MTTTERRKLLRAFSGLHGEDAFNLMIREIDRAGREVRREERSADKRKEDRDCAEAADMADVRGAHR